MCITDRNSNTGSRQNHISGSRQDSPQQAQNGGTTPSPGSSTNETKSVYWRIYAFCFLLLIDALFSVFVLTPLLPWVRNHDGDFRRGDRVHHFAFYLSLLDLGVLAAARITFSLGGLVVAYVKAEVKPEFPFDLYHPNGDRKSREELEQESLEEPFRSWFWRFVCRPSMMGEVISVTTQLICIIKCLARLQVEIGTLENQEPYRPVFWLAVFFATALSALEASYLQDACELTSRIGKERQQSPPMFLRSIASSLSLPLLADQDIRGTENHDDEEGATPIREPVPDDPDTLAEADITADSNYKAKWTDLMTLCCRDLHLISLAFVFLLLAAVAQTLVPRFLGKVLDSLEASFHKSDGGDDHKSILDVPGFMKNIKLLVVASVAGGLFSGMRGCIFTIVGGRANVRLRVMLMDALLAQDIGFFDVTKTGDITSRLSSDTTLVGDQVTLNVNVFLRSLVQAIGVLIFMFWVSWQLSILAFISVPLITLLSKWYGNYIRALSKLMQKKLADGNSVSEAAFSSMRTVRAFNATKRELGEFEECMGKYLAMTNQSAIAYCGFAAFTTAVPQLVFAIVVFYGGLLIRNGAMTSGQLVSFLLYLQSLSEAFAQIGWIFSSLTQAVGAADKVFELLHRRPRMTLPSAAGPVTSTSTPGRTTLLGIDAPHTMQQEHLGLRPTLCRGQISFENVELYYPARPKRRVLNGLTFKVEPGSTVALVGQSGGGKSSVMSLIQHLYEPSSGRVLIDGIDVHELSPEWLSRNISIVSQEPTLFARSIKANIMYGLEGTDMEPTQEQIEEAAKLANAHEFIMSMPQKYDTGVGERGVQLSGGQKQRIAIARALVRRPKVLLLDEATSALDAESEHLVQEAIDGMLARGKGEHGGNGAMTVIIVAHRLSTVRSADRIFVIKEGRVVEEGNHVELVQHTNGSYASLIRRQLEAQQKLENR